MAFDPTYPIYLGVSKSFFNTLRFTGRLHGARKLEFTDSMKQAEANARKEAHAVGEESGIVIKFETEALLKHPVFTGNVLEDIIDRIFQFITGFYAVVVIVDVVDNGGDYC